MGVDRKREEVLAQLSTVQDPDLHRDLVSLGMIQDVSIQDSGVSFSIVLTTPACPVKNDMKEWPGAARWCMGRSSSFCATWSGASWTIWWWTCRRAPGTPRSAWRNWCR